MLNALKKFLKEGGWLLLLAAILYLGGWHTEVVAFMQRGILQTGFFSPARLQEVPHQPVELDDLLLYDESGNSLRGEALKGQVVLVNIWATWCAPCVAEMPGLNSLYEDTPPETTRFMMIATDKDFQKAVHFRDKKGFSFPVYRLGQLPQQLQTTSIPATFVIDKKGLLRFKHEGMAKYNTASFKKLLSELQ